MPSILVVLKGFLQCALKHYLCETIYQMSIQCVYSVTHYYSPVGNRGVIIVKLGWMFTFMYFSLPFSCCLYGLAQQKPQLKQSSLHAPFTQNGGLCSELSLQTIYFYKPHPHLKQAHLVTSLLFFFNCWPFTKVTGQTNLRIVIMLVTHIKIYIHIHTFWWVFGSKDGGRLKNIRKNLIVSSHYYGTLIFANQSKTYLQGHRWP